MTQTAEKLESLRASHPELSDALDKKIALCHTRKAMGAESRFDVGVVREEYGRVDSIMGELEEALAGQYYKNIALCHIRKAMGAESRFDLEEALAGQYY